MEMYQKINKKINIPFLGINVIIIVGLIWAIANFSYFKDRTIIVKKSSVPIEFDADAFESDRQNITLMENDVAIFNQDNILFQEIDKTSDDISDINELAFDAKSLNDEALMADISGDMTTLDNGNIQNEIDQSIMEISQY